MSSRQTEKAGRQSGGQTARGERRQANGEDGQTQHGTGRCTVGGSSLTRRAQNAQPSKNAMVLTAKQQRAQRARRNYGSNALGKLVRKKAFRDCDYTADGHLQQFADEAGVIAFEEERYTSGHRQ